MSGVQSRKKGIKKNDTVTIIAGDERGKSGKVLKVLKGRERVIIEKLNIVKRHRRPDNKNQAGGISEKEAPIHISNVKLTG